MILSTLYITFDIIDFKINIYIKINLKLNNMKTIK